MADQPAAGSLAKIKRRNLLMALGAGIGVSPFLFRSAGAGTASDSKPRSAATIQQTSDGYKMLEVRDSMWAFKDKGEGPPALFLHSYLLNSNLWLDQIHGLKDMRRCIAPDMRGWGRSEAIAEENLDPYKYAEDVVEFIDRLNLDQPVDIVALSIGAFISGLVYELAPDKVNSLTLISGTFKFKRNFAYERYQREMARLVVVEGKDALFRRFDEYIDGKNPGLHNRARYKQMLMDTRTEMIVAYLMAAGTVPERPDLPGKIKVPVLLPMGDEDSVFSTNRIAELAGDYPNARALPIKNAGRLISMENPDALNTMLREFWNGDAKRT